MPEERKLVTILFADVTGSTALGESLDPEDVRALMGRYYEHAREIVANYGGTIEKFIGDAVMAVFGLTQAHDDDAERALAAALVLREAIAGDEILGESFQLRMGVNTGEVVATSDPSRGDFLITGDAVNVSARLQQHANPGEIVASERTVKVVQGSRFKTFVFDGPREVIAKGKSVPLKVYPLREIQDRRREAQTPFVGRKADLMQLQLLQERVIEEERPQLVSIVAPAGTGKTRLLEEFLKRLDPDYNFQIAMVRCLPYGQTLTYWPLRGLLHGLLLGEEITKQRIMGIFKQGGYSESDASRLAELILATLGIEGNEKESTDRETIFTAWRLLIEVFARQAPRILIFEDLHWASDSMLDLVEHIIQVRTHAQLLLIVLSRPELLDRRPTWGGGKQNFTAISLQPLTATQTQDLIKRLSAEMPEETRKQIVERSGGNPFFALELVRGLSDRGQAGNAASAQTLPDTVHAAVQARLDLLSRQERAIIQVASVASRAIRTPMLRAVLEEYSLHEIDTALDELLQRDMLVAAEGDSFAFRHILIRDVAYGTLSRAERIRIHSKIAAWLESTAGEQVDQYAELIAYHYREAVLLGKQAAVPKPMPHETLRAVYFLERAGEQASRGGAFDEAENYLKSAISLAPVSEHLRIYEKLGDCLVWGDVVVEAYRTALELWKRSEPRDAKVGVLIARKLYVTYMRYPVSSQLQIKGDELKAFWQEALQIAEEAGEEDEQWVLRALFPSMHSLSSITLQEVQQQIATCQQAIAYFEQQGNRPLLNIALDSLAGLLWNANRHQEALKVSQGRLTIPGLPFNERCDAFNMIAVTYLLHGQYDQCIAAVQEALHSLRPGEPVEYLTTGLNVALWAAYVSGQWAVIDSFADKVEEVRERLQYRTGATGNLQGVYMAKFVTAVARADRPAIDAAASVLERLEPKMKEVLIAYREENPGRMFNPDNSDIKGLALMMLTERELPIAKEFLEDSPFQEDMRTYAGKVARALKEENYTELAEAIEEAEAHQLIVYAARMRIVLARHTKDRSQLERARPVLERVGDRQFLRRLEEVEASLSAPLEQRQE